MNEVKIIVRTYNDAKAGREAVAKEFDEFARQTSEKFSKTFSENLSRTFTTRINEVVSRSESQTGAAGDRIGDTLGRHISTKITERIINDVYRDRDGRLRGADGRFASGGGGGIGGDRDTVNVRDRSSDRVRVSVDVDKQSLLAKMFGAGKEGASKFVSGFEGNLRSGLSNVFSGDVLSAILKGAGLSALGGLLAIPLGAAINAGILTALSGGAIAVGIAGAVKDPRVKTAIKGVKKELNDMLTDFGSNFRGPLENFLASPNKSKTGGKTGLQGVLDQVKPQIDELGDSLGQLTDKLLSGGLTGLLQNSLPGFLRAIKGGEPFINTLADKMPGIGDAIGQFFDTINNNSAGAQLFWSDFLNAMERLIPLIGAIIGAFSNMYLSIRLFFAKLRVAGLEWATGFLEMAYIAFGWIPGIGAKLVVAQKKIHQFSNDANKDLQNIKDVDVKVKLSVAFGNVWSSIHQITSALQAIGAVRKAGSKNSGFGGKRAGGIQGAASGGARSGLTWTGEDGPELIDLSPGSRVWTAGDSRRMAGQGGGMSLRLSVDRSGPVSDDLLALLLKLLRIEVRDGYGGSAQMALGVN